MTWATEDAFNEAVERRVADIRAHLLSQDTAEAMQLAIVNTHMEDKRPEMWASAAVYTSAALAVVSSALAASSADPLADENPEGGFEGLAAGEPRCAECVVNGWKNPHPAFSSQHRAWDDGRRLRAADPPASPDERLREAGEALAASIRELGRPIGDTTGGRWGRAKKALDAWVAALAAADREAPKEEGRICCRGMGADGGCNICAAEATR